MTNSVDIHIGQVWRDIDYRSYYDTLPDGTYPIPDDYEGELKLAPRLVRVEGIEGNRVLVANVHNGRSAVIRNTAFRRSEISMRGNRYTQGFVLHSDTEGGTL